MFKLINPKIGAAVILVVLLAFASVFSVYMAISHGFTEKTVPITKVAEPFNNGQAIILVKDPIKGVVIAFVLFVPLAAVSYLLSSLYYNMGTFIKECKSKCNNFINKV